uniref:Ribosome biogenesis protein BOP1 homolog n=2 Tax=Hirondellea gigas TaxID=1518452 RepID=A0A2P2I0S7_9CRUS
MSTKRKIKLPSPADILRSDTADLLGIFDDGSIDDNDQEIHFDEGDDGESNPYKYHLDENPNYEDPYYYDLGDNINKQVAFYKSNNRSKKQDEEDNEDATEDSDEEEDDSDNEDDDSDDNEGSDSDDLDDSEDDENLDTSEKDDDESEEEEDSEGNEDDNEESEYNETSSSKANSTEGPSKSRSSDTGESSSGQNGAVANNDEYADGDSSDEEEIRNTVGNIPLEWYDEYDHIGYDTMGEKIIKPDRGDSIDAFLKRIEDPDYRRTVVDRLTGQDVKLVDDDLDLIHRLVKGYVPSAQYDLYEPFLDLYSHEVMETPLSGRPEHKRSFLPSKSDRRKVSRMVHALKQAAIHKHKRQKRYNVYDLWKSDNIPVPMRRRLNVDYKAPPARLPTNNSSYNPPPEFLMNAKQLEWIERNKNGHQRKLLLARLPTKYDSLRKVPNHFTYVMDIFNRCLDLYMSSRFAYKRVKGHSKDLLPDLPRPRDLRPYPTKECLLFTGHRSIVRAITIHPLGKIMATGSDDHTIKIWEVSTSRCLHTLSVGDAVHSLAWNPNTRVLVLAAAVGKCVIIINPENYLTDATVVARTNALLESKPDYGDYTASDKVAKTIKWLLPSAEEKEQGYRIVVKHTHKVHQVVWHQQGDYFATLQPDANTTSVVTHQLARWRSQIPFGRASVKVTALSFHPKKAYFYICSQGRIRVYSLVEKKLIRLIKTNSASEFISSIAVHPSGEHFIVGSHGKRVTWYEMECTNRPFTLRYHHGAIRSVAFHNKYPLFASAADDGRVIVTHSMVYSDLIKDPLLVPVKELRNHQLFDGLCVLQIAWHPHDPCLFTAGADSTIRMWQ